MKLNISNITTTVNNPKDTFEVVLKFYSPSDQSSEKVKIHFPKSKFDHSPFFNKEVEILFDTLDQMIERDKLRDFEIDGLNVLIFNWYNNIPVYRYLNYFHYTPDKRKIIKCLYYELMFELPSGNKSYHELKSYDIFYYDPKGVSFYVTKN